jgi:hypothetical protein
MARALQFSPNVSKIVKVQQLIEVMWQIVLPLVMIVMFVRFLVPEASSWTIPLIPYFTVAAFMCIILVIIARTLLGRKIGQEIDRFYNAHPQKYRFNRSQLKKTIQKLIYELSSNVKSQNEAPKKYRIALHNIDYDGIKVLKKPRIWRKHYIAIPEIELISKQPSAHKDI